MWGIWLFCIGRECQCIFGYVVNMCVESQFAVVIQIFLNLYIRFVKGHTRKVHAKFQVPSMYGVQMNVPFVLFYKSHVQVFDRIVI